MEQFYEIPFSPNNIISKSGVVKNNVTGEIYNTWVDKHSGLSKVLLKEKNGYKNINLSRLLAMVFIPGMHKDSIVGFVDGNKSNTNLDNLKWTTRKKIQDDAFSKRLQECRAKFKVPTFSSNTGFYFDQLKECPFKPGFYYIPRVKNAIVINREGEIFNLETNKHHPTSVTYKGYINTCVHTKSSGKKYTWVPVHRLVAETFIKPAEKYADHKANDLQVNHIDGNKSNNKESNLEWVDGFENMNHGRDTGLFSNQLSVITKNVLTGDILRFRSVSRCAEYFDISMCSLFNHLKSPSSGLVPIKGFFFKYNNSEPWPSFSAEYMLDEALNYSGDYVAINKDENKTIVYSSLISAINDLNFSRASVVNHRVRKGKDAPYQGWVFKPISDFTHCTEKKT